MRSLQCHGGLVTRFHSDFGFFDPQILSSQAHLLGEGESHLPSCPKATKTGKVAAKHKDK